MYDYLFYLLYKIMGFWHNKNKSKNRETLRREHYETPPEVPGISQIVTKILKNIAKQGRKKLLHFRVSV